MFHGNITDDEFENKVKKEREEESQKEVETKLVNDENIKIEKLDKIKQNFSKINMESLQPIMAKYSISNFNEASAIPMEAFDEILALI